MPSFSLLGLLAQIKSVRVTHLILAGVGDDGSLCPGLLLFR